MLHRTLAFLLLVSSFGCELLPQPHRQPAVHNPFPQLSRVAVAPFFNLSDEATVDGRRFALAYYAELQTIPGFEVVPVSVVETAMRQHRLELSDPLEARHLAQLLNVDVLVVGAVTDYSPYYPPRCGLQVQWWAANPCFHPIPPGYGLPWCTNEEEYIPSDLVYEADMALARAQLESQTPRYQPMGEPLGPQRLSAVEPVPPVPAEVDELIAPPEDGSDQGGGPSEEGDQPAKAQVDVAGTPHWPDLRSLKPECPSPKRPDCVPNNEPVLSHTQIYVGHDSALTEALATYFAFRDDARFGGWQAYLQRSEDFIRFCCHMHVSEMLSARGGGGPAEVVWRGPHSR